MSKVTLTKYKDGTRQWKNEEGSLHCVDEPALLLPNGYISWYQNGKCHRLDGPAIIWPDGSVEYWIHGEPVEPFTGVYCE